MPAYNGHHCWNCWNVSLWLNNDEGLYREMLYYVRKYKNKHVAARHFQKQLPGSTPDGARYTLRGIVNAMADL